MAKVFGDSAAGISAEQDHVFEVNLIEEVKKCRCLYATDHPHYHNMQENKIAWLKISSIINKSVTECMTKWYYLLHCLLLHHRQQTKCLDSSALQWKHYAALQEILPYIIDNYSEFMQSAAIPTDKQKSLLIVELAFYRSKLLSVVTTIEQRRQIWATIANKVNKVPQGVQLPVLRWQKCWWDLKQNVALKCANIQKQILSKIAKNDVEKYSIEDLVILNFFGLRPTDSLVFINIAFNRNFEYGNDKDKIIRKCKKCTVVLSDSMIFDYCDTCWKNPLTLCNICLKSHEKALITYEVNNWSNLAKNLLPPSFQSYTELTICMDCSNNLKKQASLVWKACRICEKNHQSLDKLFSSANHQLLQAFRNATNATFSVSDGLPAYICKICKVQMQQFNNFYLRLTRAQCRLTEVHVQKFVGLVECPRELEAGRVLNNSIECVYSEESSGINLTESKSEISSNQTNPEAKVIRGQAIFTLQQRAGSSSPKCIRSGPPALKRLCPTITKPVTVVPVTSTSTGLVGEMRLSATSDYTNPRLTKQPQLPSTRVPSTGIGIVGETRISAITKQPRLPLAASSSPICVRSGSPALKRLCSTITKPITMVPVTSTSTGLIRENQVSVISTNTNPATTKQPRLLVPSTSSGIVGEKRVSVISTNTNPTTKKQIYSSQSGLTPAQHSMVTHTGPTAANRICLDPKSAITKIVKLPQGSAPVTKTVLTAATMQKGPKVWAPKQVSTPPVIPTSTTTSGILTLKSGVISLTPISNITGPMVTKAQVPASLMPMNTETAKPINACPPIPIPVTPKPRNSGMTIENCFLTSHPAVFTISNSNPDYSNQKDAPPVFCIRKSIAPLKTINTFNDIQPPVNVTPSSTTSSTTTNITVPTDIQPIIKIEEIDDEYTDELLQAINHAPSKSLNDVSSLLNTPKQIDVTAKKIVIINPPNIQTLGPTPKPTISGGGIVTNSLPSNITTFQNAFTTAQHHLIEKPNPTIKSLCQLSMNSPMRFSTQAQQWLQQPQQQQPPLKQQQQQNQQPQQQQLKQIQQQQNPWQQQSHQQQPQQQKQQPHQQHLQPQQKQQHQQPPQQQQQHQSTAESGNKRLRKYWGTVDEFQICSLADKTNLTPISNQQLVDNLSQLSQNSPVTSELSTVAIPSDITVKVEPTMDQDLQPLKNGPNPSMFYPDSFELEHVFLNVDMSLMLENMITTPETTADDNMTLERESFKYINPSFLASYTQSQNNQSQEEHPVVSSHPKANATSTTKKGDIIIKITIKKLRVKLKRSKLISHLKSSSHKTTKKTVTSARRSLRRKSIYCP